MTSDSIISNFAAVTYSAQTADRMALSKFVEQQKLQQFQIAGILQQALFKPSGRVAGIEAVDISTGHRTTISLLTDKQRECGLDLSALLETSNILRSAISQSADLVVVEKFGELEQNGKGLIDEILQVIVEGIPLLIAVPEAALSVWQEKTGGLGSVIPCDQAAIQQWWDNQK